MVIKNIFISLSSCFLSTPVTGRRKFKMKGLIKKPGFFYHLKQDKYKEKVEEKQGPSYLGQIYQNVKIKFSRSFTRSSCSSRVRSNKKVSFNISLHRNPRQFGLVHSHRNPQKNHKRRCSKLVKETQQLRTTFEKRKLDLRSRMSSPRTGP